MTNQEFKILAQKYEDGTATDIEKAIFEEAYRIRSQRYGEWQPDLMGQEEEVKDHIFQSLDNRIQQYEKRHKRRTFYIYITTAASIILLVAGGWLWYNESLSIDGTHGPSFTTAEVKLSADKTILTLENGKAIDLAMLAVGKTIDQNGTVITKVAKNQLVYSETEDVQPVGNNTITVPRGQHYQITLIDGTSVWLNSASQLKYSINSRSDGYRQVALDGEAYFEVSKDNNHPFIVKTNTQEVKVLGTHFNIKAYLDEPVVKTTLLEGKVQVKGTNAVQKILKPGEQSTLSQNGKLSVQEVDTELAVAWKNNQFIFDSEPIESVMRMVERRYDVVVEYKGDKTNERFGGGFSAFDQVSKVLKSLESTGKVRFEIHGNKIYVFKSSTTH